MMARNRKASKPAAPRRRSGLVAAAAEADPGWVEDGEYYEGEKEEEEILEEEEAEASGEGALRRGRDVGPRGGSAERTYYAALAALEAAKRQNHALAVAQREVRKAIAAARQQDHALVGTYRSVETAMSAARHQNHALAAAQRAVEAAMRAADGALGGRAYESGEEAQDAVAAAGAAMSDD
jgi:hypothetical protein